MTGQERRRHPRVVVDVPVRIVDQGTEHTGRLRDICREAALVESARPWPLDAEVGLRMQLPGVTEVIDVQGRVIRLVANPGGDAAMAILFTEVTPLAGLRIDFFVALQTDLGGGTGQSAG
jgi:hypothetical protein